MNQPKKNTVLWWLLRIEDKELRERAVRACVLPDFECSDFESAIAIMCGWSDTEQYDEGVDFWDKICNQATDNLIPLLAEPYTEPTKTDGEKSDAIEVLKWMINEGFCLYEDGHIFHKDDAEADWEKTPEQIYELYKKAKTPIKL